MRIFTRISHKSVYNLGKLSTVYRGLREATTVKAQTVRVQESTGRILCSTIFRQGGKKLLAKGNMMSDEDVRLLETEGMDQVWVTELEDGEVGEDDAVMIVSREISCGSLEIRLAAG